MPTKRLSIQQVVVRIAIIISLAEFFIMQLLASIPYKAGSSLEALIDTVLLVAFSTPPIYVWVVKPFVNARDDALAQISHLAFTDPLTQLANRRLLTKHLEKIIAANVRHGTCGAVLLLDLDDFKHVNDAHGHDTGDAVLVEIARRLQTGIRAEDVVGRLGGDEFVVLAGRLDTDPQRARNSVTRIAESLIKLLSEPFVFEGQPLHIGASIGVRLLGPEALDTKSAISDADTALYRAKHAGKGCTAFFD